MAGLNLAATITLDDFNASFQGENGESVYSNTKAMYGFIPANCAMKIGESWFNIMNRNDWKARLPAISANNLSNTSWLYQRLGNNVNGNNLRTAHPYFPEAITNPMKLAILKSAIIDFHSLKGAGFSPQRAYLIAAFRIRWMQLGCFYTDDDSRNSLFVEHDVVDNTHAIYGVVENFADVNEWKANAGWVAELVEYHNCSKNAELGEEFVVKHAEAFWCITEFMFRTRGHHYKDEYKLKIVEIMSSNFEGSDTLPTTLVLSDIMSLAIHPFGVRSLPQFAAKFILHGKVGNAIILRWSAAPNGTAVITTTKAALDAMKSEQWYSRFNQLYSNQVKLLKSYSDAILNNKFLVHMSASLYGFNRLTQMQVDGNAVMLEDMLDHARNLATLGHGFISAMEKLKQSGQIIKFSLSNAKSLEKYAANNPMQAIKMSTLVLRTMELIAEAGDAKELAITTLPMIEEDKSGNADGNEAN